MAKSVLGEARRPDRDGADREGLCRLGALGFAMGGAEGQS